MRPQPLFEVLGGQQLTAVLAVERWGAELAPRDEQAAWPLYGALGLVFEKHTLLLTSPLRSLRSQHGTRVGLADGSSVSLGLRATLCEVEQAEAMVSFRLGMPSADAWRYWAHQDVPVVGSRLLRSPMLDLEHLAEPVQICFNIEGGQAYRLRYRYDLDGAIEFAPLGQSVSPVRIEVTQPKGPLSWLHPERIAGFVLDNQRWRNARQWPIEVRRRFRDVDPAGTEARQLLKRACLAYFRQTPDKCRRLLALRVPVRVHGLPDGLIEEVQAVLRTEAESAASTDTARSAAPASTQPPGA